MRGRGYTRHHDERIKKRVRRYHVCQIGDYYTTGGRQYQVRRAHPSEDPTRIGQMARTPKPCSCPWCGNPRRFEGLRTVQERRRGWR